MSDQDRERSSKQDVEAHRYTARETEEPKDEDRDRRSSEEGDEVEGHILTPRASKNRAR